MSTGVIQWSKTAASNATADTAVNWAEGQAPSTVNDSARAMMAAAAKWRDDISGILATTGGGAAYAITSNQVISSNIDGMTVQFTPGSTNTGAVTLSVDGQTARPLQIFPGTNLPAGTLVSGSLYQATYRAVVTTWLLHSFDCRQWIVPLGSALPYFGATAPNSAFLFPYGQAISRTTYATLFTLFSTGFGVGDGSTTFNVPDLRGRTVVGADAMGGSGAARITVAAGSLNGVGIGAVGGQETTTLVTANLPAYTPAGSVATSGTAAINYTGLNVSGGGVSTYTISAGTGSTTLTTTGSGTFTGTAQGGTSTAVKTMQPTIVSNYILRVI